MCAANNSPLVKSKQSNGKSTTTTSKQEPKWLQMKRQNKSSADKTAKPIEKPSSSAQKPSQQSREEKRKRWAKKAKPVAKPVVRRGPVYEYISNCCSIQCHKPDAGSKVSAVDPETGKPSKKDKALGLGHWRCNGVNGCKKSCKVTPRASKPKEVTEVLTKGDFGGLKLDPYPAKLQIPSLKEN
jgi:hypothetical protein